MSANISVQAALAAALGAIEGLAVFDAPPVRAALPHAVVGEAMLGDAGAKGIEGRAGRIAVTLRDAGERPVRLRALAAAAEAAALGIGPTLGDGWRLASITPARTRIARAGDEWIATIELAARLFRAG